MDNLDDHDVVPSDNPNPLIHDVQKWSDTL